MKTGADMSSKVCARNVLFCFEHYKATQTRYCVRKISAKRVEL